MSHPISTSLDFMGVLPLNKKVKCIEQCRTFSGEESLVIKKCIFFVYDDVALSFIFEGGDSLKKGKDFEVDESTIIRNFVDETIPLIAMSRGNSLCFYSTFDFEEVFVLETPHTIKDFGMNRGNIFISSSSSTIHLKIKFNSHFQPTIIEKEIFSYPSVTKYLPSSLLVIFSNGEKKLFGKEIDYSSISIEDDVIHSNGISLFAGGNEITLFSGKRDEIVGIIEDYSPSHLISFFDGEVAIFSPETKILTGYNLNSTTSTIEKLSSSKRKSRISVERAHYKLNPTQEDVFFVTQFLTNNQMKLDYGDEVKNYPIRDRDREEEGNW